MKRAKRTKRITAVVLAAMMVSACFFGCGVKKGGSENSATDIEIAYWNAGLGTAWLDAVIEAFEDKYPQYHVTYNATASNTAVVAPFRNKDTDTVDIYMALKEYDTEYLEPIDDVLDSTPDGEDRTIREKLLPAYLELETASDGKVYELTQGGGAIGFVYNKKLFEEAGIRTLPRTTDELAAVCASLSSAGITPLCHFKGGGYWKFMAEAWFEQYDGMDYYLNSFYGCTDENGNSPSKEVFEKQDGRYETIKACEKIVTPDYVLSGSNTNDHVTIQTMFLQGEAAMMINGAWLENEMSGAGMVGDFSIMKTPVISSITDKLETVKKETDLRKLITAIDAVTDGEKDIAEYRDGENYNVDGISVSEADWEYVRKARNTTPINFSGEGMFIPNYSNAKEGAKEFIRFLYSEEGYRIYTDALHMGLPIESEELDTTGWSEYEREVYGLLGKTEQIASEDIMGKHEIFSLGNARSYAGVSFISRLSANNASDRLGASEVWDEILKAVENDYENNWLANMGK